MIRYSNRPDELPCTVALLRSSLLIVLNFLIEITEAELGFVFSVEGDDEGGSPGINAKKNNLKKLTNKGK